VKKILTLLLLLPLLSIAQVGVNTTTPRAALDVESTNNGVLIPRVQLTSILDITTVINPNTGPLETSTLVYNIAPAGTIPNNVVAGFYYWNGSQWTAIAGNASSDHDWYEVGTTVAPNAITDEMFHLGNVAIGKNTANHKLDVETTNQNVGIFNNLIKSLSLGIGYGFDNTMNINSNDETQAIRNRFLGTGTGLKTGLKNYADSSILGSKIGIDNELNASGSNYLFGMRNTLNHSGSDLTLGLFNTINNPVGSTGTTHAIENRITNNSTFETTAVFNVIDSPDGGGGGSYGIHNFIGGRKTGGKYGFRNVISSLVQDDMYGVSNSITSTVDNGSIYGLYNDFNTNSNTPTYGNSNQLGGTGDGIIRGVYSFITNSGNGNHIGILSNLSGSGNGSKIGTYTYIDPTAGGTHYGIHSEVLKLGANNFAGYFLGNVGVGTTNTNTYTFPPSRGTNGQIMQTDGFGNLSWTNPLSIGTGWSIFGNSAIVTPANPAIYGTSFISATENFIGTTNAQAFVVGTNNIERMRVLPTGNVGIGIATSPARLTVRGTINAPAIPGATSNAMLRIGNELDALDIGKAGATGNFSAWLQSGFQGTTDPMSLQPLGGNVGIGTTNPTSSLEIESGGITELKLSSRGAFGATRLSMYSDKTLPNEWRPAYIESADNGAFTGRLDFYTNGTGAANRLGSVRAMSIVNGNVGVGITNPTQKLHAFENADTNKSVILGEARQINTGTDFLNIGVKGNGNGTGGWGFGVGVLGMSDVNNTYNSTGVYALLGTVNPTFSTSFSRNQALIANGNGIGNSAMFVGGNIGIGVPLDTNPTNLVHINNATPGALRIVDGTQGANRVLTSDAAGVATWQNLSPSGFSHYLGELYLGGIIFELYKGSDGLEHGLIVSLTESSHAWQTTNTLVNANRSEDGAFNTAQMTSSPAASYVSSLGAGWYIPSIDELNILYNNRYYANKALRLGGYTLISRTGSYWSSTENTSNTVFGLFSFTGTFLQLNKSDTFVVRAIRAF
jgi:hypothetical protein